VDADRGFLDAYVNLGRLLHETGQLARAERVYRDALEACGRAPLLLFNLGVLLEDLGRKAEAADAYRGALRADPRLADGHYNLALLYDQLGRPREALRHLAQYRRLRAR
jgi:tetratricopeptide (TPR) repeat protein